MALHSPGAPTHCTSFGDRGSGKGGETMKTNKSWTCFSHAYDFHYAYRYGPFFCRDFSTSMVDLCWQQHEGPEVGRFPFSCSSLPRDFLHRHPSVSDNRESSNNRWLVCIAEVAALLCTTCSLFHEGSFYYFFFHRLLPSQQDGMKRVHGTSNNSIIIYYREMGMKTIYSSKRYCLYIVLINIKM